MLVNIIQSIEVNLQTETGRLLPFAGEGGKVVLTLKFKKFQARMIMDACYHNQATMPHFAGHYRQRGSGFGALAMGKAASELINIATMKKKHQNKH